MKTIRKEMKVRIDLPISLYNRKKGIVVTDPRLDWFGIKRVKVKIGNIVESFPIHSLKRI